MVKRLHCRALAKYLGVGICQSDLGAYPRETIYSGGRLVDLW